MRKEIKENKVEKEKKKWDVWGTTEKEVERERKKRGRVGCE